MRHLSIRQLYLEKGIPALRQALHARNDMGLPRIAKVTVNVGVGKYLKEPKRMEEIIASLATLTGQKMIETKARKAIAGFKIREGLAVGAMTTLRGKRMWDFLDRLVKAALPRVRDFHGLNVSSVDARGNFTTGIKEHMVFPEIVPERVQTPFSFQVTVTTTATSQAEGLVLFRNLGFPLQSEPSQNN